MKNLKKTEYKRLETDSSEEESQKSEKNLKKIEQVKSSIKLKQELLQKEQEIENLKQILIQTQQKLLKSSEDSESIQENKPGLGKKFVEKFEDLVFVSKKNQLLLEEFDELFPKKRDSSESNSIYSQEENKEKSSSEKSEHQVINKENSFKNDSFDMISEISYKEDLEVRGKSPKRVEKKEAGEEANKCWEKSAKTLQNQGSGDSFVGFGNGSRCKSPSNGSVLRTPTLKNAGSSSSKDSFNSSLQSFQEIQTILTQKYEDSQTKLRELYYGDVGTEDAQSTPMEHQAKKGKTQKTQATNTDINDFDPEVKHEMISESRIEKIDRELRGSVGTVDLGMKSKSRNSSFPWIDHIPQEDRNPPENQLPSDPENLPKNKKKSSKTSKVPKKRHRTILKSSEPIQKKPPPKPPVPKFSKKSVNPKPHHKKSSNPRVCKNKTLDEIIFDEGQDLVSWRQQMYNFRKNPEIVSKLMKSKIRPLSQTSYKSTRPKSSNFSSKIQSNYSNNPSSSNTLPEYRPLSSSGLSKFNKKVQDPDWSYSILDNYVTQNKKKFNFYSDFSLLSLQEIEEILRSIENQLLKAEELKKVFVRALKTLNVLKVELMLPEFWVSLPPFSEDSVLQALSKCGKLLKARNLTVKIIDLVHKREELMVKVIEREGMGRLSELERINDELLQVLVFWKYMELPFSSFVYLGEEYYDKIHKDSLNIRSMFPDFRVDSGFRQSQTSDSFNFEL